MRAGLAKLLQASERWYPLRYHPLHAAWWNSKHRFDVVPAGRRSGKTEVAKRKAIIRALLPKGAPFASSWRNPRYFFGAPTRDQARRIFWDDLLAMVPPSLRDGEPSLSDLTIRTVTGSELVVVGLDKPERIEGSPWDGGVIDEIANVKAHAWGANIRPALADRQGWCMLIGVPEGRNHYYDMAMRAQADMIALGEASEWGFFTWKSADILPASEIEAAKRDLDPMTYEQEYEAAFVTFAGRAYYGFSEANKARLQYDKRAPLKLCFDFNVDPGICAIAQEMMLPNGLPGTGWIGEVYIPRNSNTPAVCRKVIEDWGTHEGRIECYGDATGGSRGTAKINGSDWDLITEHMNAHFGVDRVWINVPRANPEERPRINAVNSRFRNTYGEIRMMVDPVAAPYLVRDFEGVRILEGSAGELDKKSDKRLTHISDGAGYYVAHDFPIVSNVAGIASVQGV